MKLNTKTVYDIEPLVQELQAKGFAFIEAGKAEFTDIVNQLADAGHKVIHDAEAPTKQGHHFLVYQRPVGTASAAAKPKATGAKRGPKPGQSAAPKTYTGIKNGDVFTGTLTDLALFFGINRITAYKALQKSGGEQTTAAGVTLVEFGKEAKVGKPEGEDL